MRPHLSLLPLLLAAAAAHAQRLTGAVRDSADSRAVSAAVVTAVDASGALVARTITDRDGAFRLDASAEARTLQVRRIGFRPLDVTIADSHRAGASMTIALRPVPRVLDPIVTTAQKCPRNGEQPEALALWEQARLGLLGTIAAAEAEPARIAAIRYQGRIRNDALSDPTVSRFEGASNRFFHATRAPAIFAERGYATSTGTGRLFHAPDVAVLFDESFRATHCFKVADADRNRRGQVGIAFTPAIGRDSLVEISGTVWLDREPLALRSLDFRFEGLDAKAKRAGAGGSVWFGAADNGVVLIERWQVRLLDPALPDARPSLVASSSGSMTVVPARPLSQLTMPLTVEGGELLVAEWPDGTALRRALPAVRGRVVERGTGRPLAGIVVSTSTGTYSTLTDSTGAWTLTNLIPGAYAIAANDTLHEPYGIRRRATATMSIKEGGSAPTMSFELESVEAMVASRCGKRTMPPGESAIVGRVVSHAGQPLLAHVDVKSTSPDPRGNGTTSVAVGARGTFAVCGLFAGTTTLAATDPGGLRGDAEIEVTGPGVQRVTIVIR